MGKVTKNIEIAKDILAIMERDLTEWEKGWDLAKTGNCINAITNKPYRGINFLMLYSQIKNKKFNDGRFLTYAQCKKAGGNVKAGERAITLIHYAEYDKKTKTLFNIQKLIDKGLTKKEISDYKDENVYTYAKPFWVFNVSQCEKLNLPELKPLTAKEIKEKTNKYCEEIIKHSPVKILEDGQNKAFYNPKTDTIHIPEKQSFKSMDDYYATILHEIAHSTANDNRVKRPIDNKAGSKEYAIEECIAQFAAVMLQNQAGIELKGKHFEKQASYIKSWLEMSKEQDKPFELVKIINQADKVCQYIIENCITKEFLKKQETKKDEKTIAPAIAR